MLKKDLVRIKSSPIPRGHQHEEQVSWDWRSAGHVTLLGPGVGGEGESAQEAAAGAQQRPLPRPARPQPRRQQAGQSPQPRGRGRGRQHRGGGARDPHTRVLPQQNVICTSESVFWRYLIDFNPFNPPNLYPLCLQLLFFMKLAFYILLNIVALSARCSNNTILFKAMEMKFQ